MYALKTIDEVLSVNLRGLRQKAGLTQEELAEKAKVSIGTVRNVEYRNTFIRLSQISALANALGVTQGQLFLDQELLPPIPPTVEDLLVVIRQQEERIRELEAVAKPTGTNHHDGSSIFAEHATKEELAQKDLRVSARNREFALEVRALRDRVKELEKEIEILRGKEQKKLG